MLSPHIAIPEPTSRNPDYNQTSWSKYAHAVESAGGVPIKVPLGAAQSDLARIATACSGVLLPGSPADLDPEKYGQEPIPSCKPKDAMREAADDLLLQDAFNLHKPILGICYGLQTLNVWRSGTLIQDLADPSLVRHRAPNTHPVTLTSGSRLSEILIRSADVEHTADLLRLSVNSSHHQAVDRPGDQLRVAARSPVDAVIEALEGEIPGQFVLGVQWHPERSYEQSSASRALFDVFVSAASAWAPRPIRDSVVS